MMNASWAITSDKIKAAVRKIVSIEHPCRVILFGSIVRGRPDSNSDVDILVVTKDDVESPRWKSIRIRRELRGISMPMDIPVISEGRLKELANRPGLIYREALREGKVVYEAAI